MRTLCAEITGQDEEDVPVRWRDNGKYRSITVKLHFKDADTVRGPAHTHQPDCFQHALSRGLARPVLAHTHAGDALNRVRHLLLASRCMRSMLPSMVIRGLSTSCEAHAQHCARACWNRAMQTSRRPSCSERASRYPPSMAHSMYGPCCCRRSRRCCNAARVCSGGM